MTAAALDVHPRVAMQILRHSRISVTMEIYTETTSEATRAALKKLGDTLGNESRDIKGQDDGNGVAARCSCEPPRPIRVAAAVLAAGPVLCGLCDHEFAA
jgi:hypothetical protein